MPINNLIKLPYYLKPLVDMHLVDIEVPPAAVSKKEPLKPADVTLIFPTKDLALKVVLVRFIQGLPSAGASPRYQLNADDLQQSDSYQLRITGFQHLRRLTPSDNNEGLKALYKRALIQFQNEYVLFARGQLKKRLDEHNDILTRVREFDREDFVRAYTNAQTFENISQCHTDLEEMLKKAVTVHTAQPQPMSPHSASVEPTTQVDYSRRNSASSSISQVPPIYRIMSAPPSIDTVVEVARTESPDLKLTPDDGDNSPSLLDHLEKTSEVRPELSRSSSASASSSTAIPALQIDRYKVFSSSPEPTVEEDAEEEAKIVINRGEFNEEFKEFLREIHLDPLPKNVTLPEDPATHSSLSHELCKIPVIVNHRRYDFIELTKIPNFNMSPYFEDPSGSRKRVYKCDIHADPESRKLAKVRLAKQTFFNEFIHMHTAAYADAGFFKQSNFRSQLKKGLIKDFDDLVMFIVANPSSRSAKIFVGMTTLQIDDPLVVFLRNTFLPDYQSAWFKHSNFLEKILHKEIKTYDDAAAYASVNINTRTARLMRN
jgi:hypothetical protein